MKILLDENIDIRFKSAFPAGTHEVFTVREMKWNGVKNGALLKLLQEHKFDCWLIVDKNLPYQQNVSLLPCTIVVLDVFRNTLRSLTALMPNVLAVLNNIEGRKVIVISENGL